MLDLATTTSPLTDSSRRLSSTEKSPTVAFHVQSTAEQLRDGFPYFRHHDSVSALWAIKWRPACAAGIYPFTDANVADFDPVFAGLIESSNDDPSVLYRPDDYAKAFFSQGERLVSEADDAIARGDDSGARDLFLRAAAIYRIARFPINRSSLSQQAWKLGKAAYEQGGRLFDPPSSPVAIPFRHADTAAGDLSTPIQAYLRLPKQSRPDRGWPVVLFICGLDAYKTDHTPRVQQHVDQGCATLSFEIPGTGDCPAAAGDPSSPDRLMSSVLDWVDASAGDFGFDTSKIIARGISTGGYYAFRIAHTHGERLFAVVAQGGGCHYMFDAAWIHAQNQMEYPFALADALAYKFGFRDADSSASIARYAVDGRKFSLVDAGIVSKPACKMLVINGMEDSIFPIEDSLLVATQGRGKDLVARGDRGHMGNPGAEQVLYRWIEQTLAGAL